MNTDRGASSTMFESAPARLVWGELSTNLLSWQTLESGIIGTGALESRRVPNLGNKVFVRVREE